jgi:hypothetical protein
MTKPPLEKIELNADVNGVSERVLSLTFGLTVYFPIPFSAQLEAMHHVFDTYLEHIPWATFKFQNLSGTAKGFKKVAASSRQTIVDWFEKKRSYGNECYIWLKDGESPTDAGDNLFEIQAREKGTRDTNADALIIRFPRDIVTDMGADALVQWLCKMLDELPYYSGHAGYVLATSTMLTVSPVSTLMNERMYAVGKRFIGIEIERPLFERYEMKKFVRPPSWLTFLSKDLLASMGGIESLRKSLKGDFGYTATKFGWCIRAGALPQIGDKNRKEDALPEQRALAEKLAPLYSPMPVKLFSNKDHAETLGWHRRLQGD